MKQKGTPEKKIYTSAKLDVYNFSTDDVIHTSVGVKYDWGVGDNDFAEGVATEPGMF